MEIFAFSLCFFSNFLLLTARLFLLTLPIFQKDWKNIKKPKNVWRSWNAMTTEQVSFNFYVGWCKSTHWHSSNIGRHHEQVPRITWVRYGNEHGWFLFDLFTEKLQEEKKDTFVEKLATQVIKNLQVKISSIHIRYEDDVSIDKTKVSSFRFKSQWSLGESY